MEERLPGGGQSAGDPSCSLCRRILKRKSARPCLSEAPGLISWALQLLGTASHGQSEHPASGVEMLYGHMPSGAMAAGTAGCMSWTLNPWWAVLSSLRASSRLSALRLLLQPAEMQRQQLCNGGLESCSQRACAPLCSWEDLPTQG